MEGEKIKLLVVDDNEHNLELVSKILKLEGYEIILCENGRNALAVLNSQHVDLILLDIMMPGLDGFDTCIIIKENNELADIPVIFLTARTELNDIVKGFNVGGVDYVSKPFSKEELIARVRNHVQLKLMRDYLKKEMENAKESRNEFMRLMLSFGKSLNN